MLYCPGSNADHTCNQNGGRNFALQHGRSLAHARWVLPLDGNSFFTPLAMHSIVQTLSIAGEGDAASRYVIIPMARLLSNQGLLPNNSIALVPHSTPHEGTSASHDAASHHRPESAPDTPEEPQVGFRYDSTETFQEAMRYGRRSKLELLWRLGAIPYSRGLDRRTLPWEQSDRDHVTTDSWGSIPGVEGTDHASIVHLPHGDLNVSDVPAPERGPFAYAKAGWVYRLFSGDQNQELHTQEAIALRNMNRIKGIVAFLERLDDKVARGVAGCSDPASGECGFSSKRLWSFETEDVERLRQQFKAGFDVAIDRVEQFEKSVYGVHAAVRQAFSAPDELLATDPAEASLNATLLAMAGFLTGNSSYSALSADLITARFVRQVPMFYRVADQREQLKRYQSGQGSPPVDISLFDGSGYAFPAPPSEADEVLSWSGAMGHHSAGAALPTLPFDPLHFDVRLDSASLIPSSLATDPVRGSLSCSWTPCACSAPRTLPGPTLPSPTPARRSSICSRHNSRSFSSTPSRRTTPPVRPMPRPAHTTTPKSLRSPRSSTTLACSSASRTVPACASRPPRGSRASCTHRGRSAKFTTGSSRCVASASRFSSGSSDILTSYSRPPGSLAHTACPVQPRGRPRERRHVPLDRARRGFTVRHPQFVTAPLQLLLLSKRSPSHFAGFLVLAL